MAAVELASGVISLGADTREAGRNISDMFNQTERQAQQSGERAGGGFGKKFSGALGPLLGGATIAGVGAAFLSIGNSFDEMVDNIAIGTGKSGKALDELSSSAKEVGKTVPQSFGEVGSAIAKVNATMGLTGQPLQDLTTQFLNLSRITGTDVDTNITALTRTFGDWGVATDKQSSTLDYLFKTSQATGAEVGGLAEKLVQFGAPLRSMGFDLQTSTALLGTFQKTGVNTELVMGSMRIALSKFAKAGQDAPTTLRAMIAEIKAMPSATAAAAKGMEIFGTRAGADMADTIRGGKFEIDALMETLAGSETTINGAAADTADFAESWAIFKNKLMAEVEPAATKLFDALGKGMGWISDHGIPAVEGITAAVTNFGGTEAAVDLLLDSFHGMKVVVTELVDTGKGLYNTVNENKAVFGTLAGVITTLMLPSLVALVTGWTTAGIAATVSGAQTAIVWTMLQASAIKSAALFVVAQGTIVAGWVASAAAAMASAVTMAAAWLIGLGPVGLIIAAITLIVGVFVLLWKKCDWFRNFWIGAWEWIKNAAVNAWEGFLKPLFDKFLDILGWVGEKALWLKDAIGNAFDFIGNVISLWWNNIVKPVWDAFGNAISWVIDHIVKPAFDGLKTALGAVGDFFGKTVDGIKNAWEGVKRAVATPINFVIETVWNGGLLKAWNKVAEWLPGLEPMQPLAPVAFARGGGVFGGKKGKDSVNALLMPDEHVWTTAETDAVGGHGVMAAMRNMAKRGISFTWDAVAGLNAAPSGVVNALATAPKGGDMAGFLRAIGVPGYATGGPGSGDHMSEVNNSFYPSNKKRLGKGNFHPGHKIDPNRIDWTGYHKPMYRDFDGKLYPVPGYADGGAVRPAWEYQLENGHEAAQSRNGNPYTWGFEDCSGYMSMIADAIINGGRGIRRWATSSFPGGQPWVPGLGQGFSVGVHDDPGGPGGGHTAGTLSAVGRFGAANVESGGSHGYVAYGGPAQGADSSYWDGKSPGRFHLAIGADGAFETAGAGGGPAPAEQSNFLKDRVKGVFNDFMDPIKGLLPQPPPEFMKIPGKVMDMTVDKAVDAAFNVVGGLGSGLRTVYEGAKDALGSVTGLFRDHGGFIWPGLNLVRNETGKPEAVLNWGQMGRVEKFMDQAGGIMRSSIFEILSPSTSLPNPEDVLNRYTLKASDTQPVSANQSDTEGTAPAESDGGPRVDASINIANLTLANVEEWLRKQKAMQARNQMQYAGRITP